MRSSTDDVFCAGKQGTGSASHPYQLYDRPLRGLRVIRTRFQGAFIRWFVHISEMTVPLPAILGIAFFVSERLLAWRWHSSKVAGSHPADRGTLRALWIVALLSIAAGLVVALWPLGPRLPASVPWEWIALAVFAFGTALRWWAIIHLGRFFTVDVTVVGDHRVVDNGPYRLVRHPSYTGLLMQYAGLALSFDSVLALPIILVPVFLSLRWRMRIEEEVLTGALGDDYSAYRARTKRIVPLVY